MTQRHPDDRRVLAIGLLVFAIVVAGVTAVLWLAGVQPVVQP